MFLFPIVYYFSHPEPYHMRTLDPLVVILGCLVVVTWRSAQSIETGLHRPEEQKVSQVL